MGDALGVSSALESLSRVIAPTLGGWLLGAVGAWAPGVLAAILMVGLAPYAWQRLIVRPNRHLVKQSGWKVGFEPSSPFGEHTLQVRSPGQAKRQGALQLTNGRDGRP